ncbi:MAG: carbon-nitrogen hydrolase family protein [Lentisphaeria bacterium]|nr:carbon-nitrogen hydrolase family protein [Lentisphaeria bacterium]NQZ68639.1 carbon-nitrogen hydrolase family protein [Lentisphaeria bacterium]
MSKLRVAVNQPYTKFGDVDGNLDQVIELARLSAACGCRIALSPEVALYGYSIPPEQLARATPADGPVAERIAKAAKDLDICIVTGVFELEESTGDIYISQFIGMPNGDLLVQRKVGGHEKPGIARAPAEWHTFEVDGVTCAVTICIDSVNPIIDEYLIDAGCQLQLVPVAGGGAHGRHYANDWDDDEKYANYLEALSDSCSPKGDGFRQRRESQMAMACANLATGDDGHDYFQQGHSQIYDSSGALVALIPGEHVQEFFSPRMAWGDITPLMPKHRKSKEAIDG